MKHQTKWDRCLYCDASIAGDDAHVAVLHDPYCPHGKSLRRLDRADRLLLKCARWFEENEAKLKSAGIGGFSQALSESRDV